MDKGDNARAPFQAVDQHAPRKGSKYVLEVWCRANYVRPAWARPRRYRGYNSHNVGLRRSTP